MELVKKVYYWNARLGGKTAVLSGPFLTPREAELTADYVSPVWLLQQDEAKHATFGVLEVNAPGMGEGFLNEYLPPHLLGNLAIDTGIRSH